MIALALWTILAFFYFSQHRLLVNVWNQLFQLNTAQPYQVWSSRFYFKMHDTTSSAANVTYKPPRQDQYKTATGLHQKDPLAPSGEVCGDSTEYRGICVSYCRSARLIYMTSHPDSMGNPMVLQASPTVIDVPHTKNRRVSNFGNFRKHS